MKTAVTVLLSLATLYATAQTEAVREEQSLMGMWRNKSGAGLDIVDSSTVYIIRGSGREKVTSEWTMGAKPQLTLTLIRKDSTNTTTVKTLLRLVNDDTMQWRVVESETKPASLRYGSGESMFLKRINRLMN